ncbi:TPA: exodeoxyribonuclease VII small subunit [Bacillus anthracis]|uniref:Exodeoxyribonuclease 7 small subunit n=1 Tax=Alkaliphilus flagellatus TaxID=2841507 RepID=A0ABS6G4Z5_9FIRM|nr:MULTISPECIES: exodeoxyribonuclease VII small subunit [Alkaliphilus]MBU5677562.1 exodeoxyribonuclease VII small subunit [Alkaliphilus flagellatus]QUH20699.1 exodeoxyribonuclease VII small subunit [Alkaliphilus sp. B6464]HDR5039313.1 exodeoxyribonuclease VII small subunit [Bacillus anthracis]
MSNLNFEEALTKLEEAVNKLEKEQLSLDDSLKIFEEGINLYRLCSKELNEVEKKINTIVEENGEFKEVPFEYEEGE